MIVLYREIMMLWLCAGYGETGAGAPNQCCLYWIALQLCFSGQTMEDKKLY